MLVLCYGMPKSGSTLAFEIVKGMLSNAGFEQENFINDVAGAESLKAPGPNKRNFIGELSKERIVDVMATIGPNRRIAVKTHTNFPDDLFGWFEELQARGELQIIASYRDPREMCLSLMDAAERARKRDSDAFREVGAMRRAQRSVRNRIKQFRKWASVKGGVRIGYDTVAFLPEDAISHLETVFNLTCDHAAVKHYAFHEAGTQRNKAVPARYRNELNAEENAEMLSRFGEFISRVCDQDDQSWFDLCRRKMLKATGAD
jgi:hypothetical protein